MCRKLMSNIRSVLSMLEYVNGCWYAVCPLCGRKFCFNNQYRAFIKQLRLINHPCEGELIPEPIPPTPPVVRYNISVSYNELEDCSAAAQPLTVIEAQTSILTIIAPNNVDWSITVSNATIEILSGTGDAELEITEIIGNVSIEIHFAEDLPSDVIRYIATNQLNNAWIVNNTRTELNTYDSETQIGLLYLNDNVTSIGDYAFEVNMSILSIYIPNQIELIGYYAFYDCECLTTVELSNSVTSIDSGAFNNCISLTSIEIPNSVTSIGDHAFSYCSSLTSISIPDAVTVINNFTFSGCTNLESISLSNNLTYIDERAFGDCSSLVSVVLPNSIASMSFAIFEGCSSLVSVVLPNSITSINDYDFRDCISLSSIEIPNGVRFIAGGAFSYCISLNSIEIPSNVTSIGNGAFRYCSNLSSVTCYAVLPPSLGINNFNSNENDTLYVPNGSVYAYRENSNWNAAFNTITDIPNS